ncbi:unnamed protein product, partial [Ectocarpus sp. 12 AP-2014]
VLGSLSNNDLALVVSSPVITAAASSEGRRDGGVGANTSLAPKQTVDALTALLLAEEGFKAQQAVAVGIEEERVSPRSRRRGGKGKTPASSRPPLPSSVAERRRRIELGAQMALARALGRSPRGAGHRRDCSPSSLSSFCSSFAVRLDPRPRPPKPSSGKDKGGRRASREEEEEEEEEGG